MIIVAVGFEVFDEFVDSGVGVGEGVGEFDDLGFGLVDFESEPVDGEGGVVVGGVVEEGAAEGGAGGWWWVGGGVGDGFGVVMRLMRFLVSRSRWRPRPGRMSW